jgi:hypothetical protein
MQGKAHNSLPRQRCSVTCVTSWIMSFSIIIARLAFMDEEWISRGATPAVSRHLVHKWGRSKLKQFGNC